jgi:hypothetical protein
MTATTKSINASASDSEWEELYKWVEERTLLFESLGDKKSPWLMPTPDRETIIKRIHGSSEGGWLGMPIGEGFY